LPIAHFTQEIV